MKIQERDRVARISGKRGKSNRSIAGLQPLRLCKGEHSAIVATMNSTALIDLALPSVVSAISAALAIF